MRSRSLVLIVVVLGVLMGAVDTTIVLLALPTIVQDLHSDLLTVIWVILIYLLEAAVLTTQLGRLGDSYGRARIYNLGFLIFTLGSALCGLSPNAYSLIVSRAVQALGASMLQANGTAVISDNFPPNERGKAFGFTGIGWGSGAILGVVLGGVLTTLFGWRSIFYINIPIGIAATFLGFKFVRDSERVKRGVDVPGLVLLGLSLTAITLGAGDVAGQGITALDSSLIGLGLILLVPFTLWEGRARNPLIDLSAFRIRVLTYSLLASLLQSAGFLGTSFLLIMYLQGIRGLSPLNASLLLIPGFLVGGAVSPFAGRLSDLLDARIPATVGIGLMILSTLFYASSLTKSTPLVEVVLALVAGGIGNSLFFPANNNAVISSVPREIYGGISGVLRTLGNMGVLLSYVLTISVASLSVPRDVAFQVFVGTSNLIGGVADSFLGGLRTAFLVSAGILVAAAVLSASRGNQARASGSGSEGGGTV